jgi:carbon monoxide dehydrogenase subunit G
VKHSSEVVIAAPIEVVIPWVSDLSLYPQWMPLVHSAELMGDDSWAVELRAKVGVFARSKRLRMCRTHHDATRIVFERKELDGRKHSEWILEIELQQEGSDCRVAMHMAYGGNLWTAGVLDRVLASHVDAGKSGLARLVYGVTE